MATVLTHNQLTTQQLLEAIAQLDRVELEKVARHVTKLRMQKPKGQEAREAELIRATQRRLPRVFMRRYRELIRKRQAETLTEGEYQELLRLGEEAEAFHSRRIQALGELATLRQIDIDVLRRDLEVEPERL